MKQLRIILFVLTPVMLVLLAPTFLPVGLADQIDPDDYISPILPYGDTISSAEIPPLEEGSLIQSPITSTPPEKRASAPASTEQLAINVWYGDEQTFSTLGSPQLWANILGTVTGLDLNNPTNTLSYSINGGPEQPLNIGPDKRRLYGPGDFNIELSVARLLPLPDTNQVVITAKAGGNEITKNVTVRYQAGTTWPLPYEANWSALSNVQAGAQVVDGQWAIAGGKLLNSNAGYDRIVAIGDYNWKDYEVKVPITIKSWNTAEWNDGVSNGGAVGIAVRWRGHFQTANNEQPRIGWNRVGVLAYYRLQPSASNPSVLRSALELRGNLGRLIGSRSDLQLAEGTTYWFKLSVQSSSIAGQPSTYRLKVWEAGAPEPVEWSLVANGVLGEPATGSLLLIAHQAEAEFGNVEVRPLPSGPFTINVQNTTNGDIIVEPNKPSYAYGERVQIRAQGITGFKLGNWTGAFTGSRNPIVHDVTQNFTIGANFIEAPTPPQLNITTTGQGTVNRSAQPPYLYGQAITLIASPQSGNIFASWGGDLKGSDNPVQIVLDDTKNITATFIPSNQGSPVSDDFNACALNTNLWEFIDPIGDGSYAVVGNELRLSVPPGVVHDNWTGGNNTVRVMQETVNTAFEIEVKFDSVVAQRFQMQGVLVEQDAQNMLRFEVYHDGNGVRLMAVQFENGTPKIVFQSGILPSTPPYIRVSRIDGQWNYLYSNNGSNWSTAGSFSRTLNVTKTGVYAGNSALAGQPVPAHTAVIDYFFNTLSPIIPEDGNPIDQLTVQVNTIGEGSVTLDPEKDFYQCNEPVTLRATPAPGWTFTGWSGDLSGNAPVQQITVVTNYEITARFTESGGGDELELYLPIIIR